jgi:NAD(P)-dependent dehydrogenase (short-subunit alcohol dehydrogenase family)
MHSNNSFSCSLAPLILLDTSDGLTERKSPTGFISSIEECYMATVLVTGTSKGIGFETALAFARSGHHVFATMRDPAKAPKLAEVAASEALSITISQMDVDLDESVRKGIAEILAECPLDVLVNNAGIEAVGSVEEQPLSHVRTVMETNYFGAVRCMQAVLPIMRQRQSGCIVNVSSVAGRIANPPTAAYCASKSALEAFSEALAGEAKTFNVRVAVVEPGVIDTSLSQRIAAWGSTSAYSQSGRFAVIFASSLQNPVPPSLVAQKILEVADSSTWQLRHLVGPDAAPLIEMRKRMTDEEWVEMWAASDATFFARFSEEMSR